MGRELLDDLVGSHKQRVRHGQAERVRSLEINRQFELGRLLGRQFAGIGPFEDAIDVGSRTCRYGPFWRSR
jgi:hypothetical protein